MGSTKLTNLMREGIVHDLLVHRFSKAADRLVTDRAAFAGRIYRDIYSLTVRKRLDDLPNGWLPDSSTIAVQFGDGGGYCALSFNGAVGGTISRLLGTAIDTVEKRVMSAHYQRCAKVYDVAHPLATQYAELEVRKADLVTEIQTAKRQAQSALASASTIGGLIAMWPEAEPFARKHETTRAPLPALPTSELNKLLDLPIAEAA